MFLYRCKVRDTWYVQVCRSLRRPDKRVKREYVASLGTPQEALASIRTQLAATDSDKTVLHQMESATLKQWEARILEWLNEEKSRQDTPAVVTTTLPRRRAAFETPGEAKPVSIDRFSFWLQAPLSKRVSLYERHTDPSVLWGMSAAQPVTSADISVEYKRTKAHLHLGYRVEPILTVHVSVQLTEKPYRVRFYVVTGYTDGAQRQWEVTRQSRFKKDLTPEVKRLRLSQTV